MEFKINNKISFKEKIKFLKESKIEDNINLIKNYKSNNFMIFNKMKSVSIVAQQIKILNKRIGKFLKDED